MEEQASLDAPGESTLKWPSPASLARGHSSLANGPCGENAAPSPSQVLRGQWFEVTTIVIVINREERMNGERPSPQSNSWTHGYSVQFLKSSLNLNNNAFPQHYANSSTYAFSNYKAPLPIQYCFAVGIKILIQKSLMWLLFSPKVWLNI